VIKSITEAIRRGDPNAVLTNAQDSIQSHRIVFAAERARCEKRVVELNKPYKPEKTVLDVGKETP